MTEVAKTCVEILQKAARFGVADCQLCPAYPVCPTGTAGWNNECMLETAADLIESLSAQLEQVTRERDALLDELKGECDVCANRKDCTAPKCRKSQHKECEECPCRTCIIDTNWKWEGVEVEG